MRRKITRALKTIALLIAIGVILLVPQIWGDVAYPVKYEAEITAAANEFNLNKSLLFALVLSESRFRADVVSHAGAVGLTQLLPSTAAGVARKLGMTGFKSGDLFDPAINARIGAAYLRSLLDMYDQNVELALMGYNGGPGAANRYLANGTLPRETNRYYQIVIEREKKYAEIFAEQEQQAQAEAKKKPTGVQGAFSRWFGF